MSGSPSATKHFRARDTRWLIALGVCLGVILFISNGERSRHMFAVGVISYRPGTPEDRENRAAPVRWNRVVVGVVGFLAVVVGILVLSFV